MLSLIDGYRGKNQKAGPEAYNSWIKWITVMDRFIDVMNGNPEKGCGNIDSADHNHVYELLDVVVFHTHWRDQHKKHSQHFLPRTTYQDIVWSAIGIVGVARKQLRDGHTMCRDVVALICARSPSVKRGTKTLTQMPCRRTKSWRGIHRASCGHSRRAESPTLVNRRHILALSLTMQRSKGSS